MPQPLFLGLDIGGTKTAALAARADVRASESWIADGANLQRHGVEAAAARIAAAIREAKHRFDDTVPAAVCAGVAGAGRPADQEQLEQAVRETLGPDEAPDTLVIIPDAHLAIDAAFRGESGLLLIAGTGSIVLARDVEGRVYRAGGWGAQLGDEGSGYRIGLRALQAVANLFDGGPATTLHDRLRAVWNIEGPEQLIEAVYREQRAPATLAPIVVDAARTDAVAREILSSEAADLALRARWLLSRDLEVVPRLVFTGGLTQVPLYRRLLTEALADAGTAVQVVEPAESPAEAALRRARQSIDG